MNTHQQSVQVLITWVSSPTGSLALTPQTLAITWGGQPFVAQYWPLANPPKMKMMQPFSSVQNSFQAARSEAVFRTSFGSSNYVDTTFPDLWDVIAICYP